MKRVAWVTAVFLAILIGVYLSRSNSGGVLGPPAASEVFTEAEQAAIAKIRAFPGTLDVEEVSIAANKITLDQHELKLTVFGHSMTATMVRSEQVIPSDKMLSPDNLPVIIWYGNLEPHATVEPPNAKWQDPLNSITLVKHDDTVTGTIRQGSALYQLRPLGRDRHLVIALDSTKMPREEEPLDASASHATPATKPTITLRSSVATIIDVMTVVPHKAINDYDGDLYALMQLGVAMANQSYINSDIGIDMRLVGYQPTDYEPSSSPDLDLRRLRAPNDGFMDDSLVLRNDVYADVVLYIPYYDTIEICGRAQGNNVTAEDAFAYVNANCIPIYTLGHEIGHLQAARHQMAVDPTPTPYTFGHGYVFTAAGKDWTTIMGTRAEPPVAERLNLWSNPDLRYEGIPMGDPETADNHRVLELTKEAVSKFRQRPDEPSSL